MGQDGRCKVTQWTNSKTCKSQYCAMCFPGEIKLEDCRESIPQDKEKQVSHSYWSCQDSSSKSTKTCTKASSVNIALKHSGTKVTLAGISRSMMKPRNHFSVNIALKHSQANATFTNILLRSTIKRNNHLSVNIALKHSRTKVTFTNILLRSTIKMKNHFSVNIALKHSRANAIPSQSLLLRSTEKSLQCEHCLKTFSKHIFEIHDEKEKPFEKHCQKYFG